MLCTVARKAPSSIWVSGGAVAVAWAQSTSAARGRRGGRCAVRSGGSSCWAWREFPLGVLLCGRVRIPLHVEVCLLCGTRLQVRIARDHKGWVPSAVGERLELGGGAKAWASVSNACSRGVPSAMGERGQAHLYDCGLAGIGVSAPE